MKKLHTPGQKQILIMKGEGLGCDYVAKMIFAIESSKNSNEGFYLNDVSDWALANSQIADTAAVVLILNANLSEWNTILEHQMFPSANRGGSLLVIMTTNENDVNATLEPFVLDASNHDALPTKLEKAHVFDMMAKRKVLTVITGDLDKTKKATKNDPRPTITTRTRESILQALGTHMWVRRLKTFFVGEMEEGSLFFRKPDPQLVEEFKKLFANDRICSKALGLIVTYMFGRYDSNIAKRLQNTHAIKVYQSDIRDAEHASTKLPYPRFKHIANYCDRCLKQVEFNGNDGLKQLQEAMLIDESNQFAGDHIRISLMVALNEVIPQGIIESCDEDFFFNFVKCEKTGGKPEHAFIRTEQGLKAFFKRIMYHWEHDMKRCIGHQVLFRNFEGFLKYLKHKKHMRWNILSKLDNNYCVLYYGMERGDQCKTLTEIILNEGTWKKKRKQKHLLQMAKEQEEKALIHAAELKNTSAFKCLVQNGVPITENAFIAALKEIAVGIIEFCLNGAEFDDDVWTNCLHECLRVNNHRILQTCMEAKQSLLNQSCTDTMPLIHRVLSDQMMLKVLLEGSWSKHVNVNIIYQSEGDKGTTALMLATEDGNIIAVEYLLQKGAKQRQPGVDYPPICIAAKNGHLNIVKALVNNDITILDDPECGQERLITIASRCGFHDIVNFIKESKSSA
ncbi:uncharacterized protein LOC127860655 [Dreissena polymorpha]|uniref:Uncharacterized protein n=1 Tax=Dreissena polymorpha TaxID=45954 RepID=A0A9D4BJ07_DREPO|nr:uncharacterized protein LOC127860655 [Dreissena polymorpha]KAH3705120.1 hypothetical protein DPMN_080185 [Dreissena polymorpha]